MNSVTAFNRSRTTTNVSYTLYIDIERVILVFFCSLLTPRGTSCFGCQVDDVNDGVQKGGATFGNASRVSHPRLNCPGTLPQESRTFPESPATRELLHSAASCLLAVPLAAGAMMVAVGVAFLMEVRRMWEVLCR